MVRVRAGEPKISGTYEIFVSAFFVRVVSGVVFLYLVASEMTRNCFSPGGIQVNSKASLGAKHYKPMITIIKYIDKYVVTAGQYCDICHPMQAISGGYTVIAA